MLYKVEFTYSQLLEGWVYYVYPYFIDEETEALTVAFPVLQNLFIVEPELKSQQSRQIPSYS